MTVTPSLQEASSQTLQVGRVQRWRQKVILTLQQQLYVLILLAILPALAIQIYGSIKAHNERAELVRAEALRLAKFVSGELDRIIEANRAVLITIARGPSVRAHDQAKCTRYVVSLADKFPAFIGFSIINSNGHIWCSSRSQPAGSMRLGDLNFSQQDFFKEAKAAKQFTISSFTLAQGSKDPILPLSLPLSGPTGRFDGVISSGLNLFWLNNYFASKPLPPDGVIGISDRDGTNLVRVPPLPEGMTGTRMRDESRWMLTAVEPGTTESVARDGVERIIGFLPPITTPNGLLVAVGIGKRAATAKLWASMVQEMALLLLTLVLALLAAAVGGRLFVARPVTQLVDTTDRWRRGDLRARAGLQEKTSEIGRLGAAFDNMADALEAREQELKGAITRRDTAVAHQALLMDELNHRVKNMLAAVQSIVAQTLQTTGDSTKARDTIESRLIALARSHDLLTRERWEGAGMHDLAMQTLAPFGAKLDGNGRWIIHGDNIKLRPKVTLALGMALHELATNAVKYGALSVPEGIVSLTWQSEAGDGEERLKVKWQESEGPVVSKPSRKGFGSELIETALASELDGTIELNYASTGLICLIDIPIRKKRVAILTEAEPTSHNPRPS
jgi:two-component sensor histidine kinase